MPGRRSSCQIRFVEQSFTGSSSKTSVELNLPRRFVGVAAMSIAATQLGIMGSANAQTGVAKPVELPSMKPGTNTSFGPLKQIDAGLLNVAYAQAGPADGPGVILLHGWPYDIHSFVDVASLLAYAGYRVNVPYRRGYGATRFLSSETFQNGQQSAVDLDIIALMDALKIHKATLAGFDRGARTADIIAALWPERCKALVAASGYLIGSQESGKIPLPAQAELHGGTNIILLPNAAASATTNIIWQLAAPKWDFDDATFDHTAASFDDPDHVAIVIHNYRWRLDLAEAEPKHDDLEKKLAEKPVIIVPTITLEGDAMARPSRSRSLSQQILGQICAPAYQWRRRAQSAPGTPRRPSPKRSSTSPKSDRPWPAFALRTDTHSPRGIAGGGEPIVPSLPAALTAFRNSCGRCSQLLTAARKPKRAVRSEICHENGLTGAGVTWRERVRVCASLAGAHARLNGRV
jgi:pimeloyl-ACP methyl ester carboxylesterase